MANDPQIVAGGEERIDILICEVKSGKDNVPNPIWRHASTHHDMVQYIVRFCGILPDDGAFTKACRELSEAMEKGLELGMLFSQTRLLSAIKSVALRM